ESVLVLNDSNDEELIESLLDVLADRDIEHELVRYEEPEKQGQEPPKFVAKKMKKSNVFIAPTVKSLSWTKARIEANEAGARGATLPSINRTVWEGALQADYNRVEEITEKGHELLKGVEKVKIESPSGTDLEVELGDKLVPGKGIVHEPGEFSNLPAGEVYTAPLDANGVMVIDNFVVEGSGTKVRIRDGKVTEIIEAKDAEKIRDAIENIENGENIAEFGLGTNPQANLVNNVLQDEKSLGTVHIAMGNSMPIAEKEGNGVESEIHWDNVIRDPTVWFDDKKVLDEGEPVFLDE
ncbi:MAG: aminopeptidase, partial [Candidatus Aenigmatarchaeota archaeon]